MILLAFGTRPEYLKIKPLINELENSSVDFCILFTGQHEDLLENVKPDQHLHIKDNENRLDSIVSSVMNNVDFSGIDHVLVQGDTTSVLAVAISAYHHRIPIIHLEAGLRTYDLDNPYPEEANRQLVSILADIHLCPTKSNLINLENEMVSGEFYVVGNTILDGLDEHIDKAEYMDKVLVTMHRRENHELMDEWFTEINKLAQDNPEIEFILPMHPNPNVQKHMSILTHVNVVEPMGRDELLKILVKTKLVITDSGGLQEECSFFNKKCLVCRKVTERPETLGQTSFLISKPDNLDDEFKKHLGNFVVDFPCPFGDGTTSKQIIKILENGTTTK